MARYAMAAGVALRDAEGRLLLVHQRYGERRWDWPGGASEPDESPEETAVREAREEIGLDVAPYGLIGVYFNRKARRLLFVFAATVTGGTFALQADEINEAGWFTPGTLPPLTAWKAQQVADAFVWRAVSFLRTRTGNRDDALPPAPLPDPSRHS